MSRWLAFSFVLGALGCGPSPRDIAGDYRAVTGKRLLAMGRIEPTGTFTLLKTHDEPYRGLARAIEDKGAFNIVIFDRLFHVGEDSTGACGIPVRLAGNDGFPASAAYVGEPGARCLEQRPQQDAAGKLDGRSIELFMTDCVSDFECAAAQVRFERSGVQVFSVGAAFIRYPAGTEINGVVQPNPFELVGTYQTELLMERR